MSYDYFYNREAEQYIHYTLPKLFFENKGLNSLPLNAKFLYAILLDRAKSSYKNGFIDENGKVYVHYAQAKIMKLLNIERTQLCKYLNELDVKKGIGLIERTQKLGKGKTDRIYVKNFAKQITDDVMPVPTSDMKYTYFCDDVSAARFKYYPLPKVFFHDVDYAKKNTYSDDVLELQRLPSNAKMAYACFLDLLQLSISKGKKDEYGRYYVICTEKDLQELLGCCLKTVRQTLNQLDTKNGVGLIERSADNPAIIYVLDYSVSLSYKADPKVEKNKHQKEKSEHQKEKSKHQEEEKNEHQKEKSKHQEEEKNEHQKEKSEHQKEINEHQEEKSEHPIYNNPYFNNPNFIDTHSINQSFANADRQTDRLQQIQKEMSFSEMLEAIEYPYRSYIPEDESYFNNGGESERDIDKCTLPYWLKSNPQALREALKFIFSYSSYASDNDKEIRILLDTVIKSLVEMLKNDYCTLDKQTVKYYQIVDIINDIMHNSSPMDWLYSFRDEWSQILSERDIKRPEAYLKTCIWNSLNNFQFKENNSSLQADYDCKQFYGCCVNNYEKI